MDASKILSKIIIEPHSTLPMYLQIANCLTTNIMNAQIPANTKLPPERQLAQLLNVSRTTAISAYRLLEERGLAATRIGSGTYVTPPAMSDQPEVPWEQLFIPQYNSPLASLLRTLIANPTADDVISMAAGMPDPTLYPLDLIELTLGKNTPQVDRTDFGYIPTDGYLPLRHSLTNWLKKTNMAALPENLLIVSGSQQGLYLVVKTFLEPRDYVIVESPTYLGAIQIFESAGARILCLPQTGSYDFGLLEDFLIRYRPKLFYTIPTFQNPTGRVTSLRERQELIRLAARHRLVIVEDDPYSQLYYDQQPPPNLKSLDTYGGVIYLGTFSKILFPGLRIGWVNAPVPVINRMAMEKQYVDLHSNNLSQQIIHRCLEEDYLPGHLRTIRTEYKKRRDAMARALNQYCSNHIKYELAEGGFYFWCKVDASVNPAELLRQAAASGISFVPGEAFYTNGSTSQEIRLSFSTHDQSRLTEGIRVLGRILGTSAATAPIPRPSAGRPII